jgi:hypothetical protein
LRSEITPHLSATLGWFNRGRRGQLDENYLEASGPGLRWRFGRLRSQFGHSDWDDYFYTGFVRPPLMRITPFAPGPVLARLDAGADIRGGSPTLEYTLGVIDAHAQSMDVFPRRPDHLVARAQTYVGGLILGLNALVNNRSGGAQTRLYDLDLRWSVPQLIVKGELLAGTMADRLARGYYLDLYFHPITLYKTTLLARVEGTRSEVSVSGPYGPTLAFSHPRLVTVGVKQMVARWLRVDANHGWGNGAATARGATGWSFQIANFLYF